MDNDTIFPSSPPHATANDPPSSPFFEPQDQYGYGAFSPKSSSPAPIFSSDDSRESMDVTNYQSPRLSKNKRKGAWYETGRDEPALATPEPKKIKIERNYDSGIYMMSDASASFDDFLTEHKAPFSGDDACEAAPPLMSTAEALFCSRLREGLETNSESYDFTGMSLKDGDIKRIGDLNSVIKNPPDPGNDLPIESQYRSMAAELFVNLGGNNLCRLSPSLFQLEHLTTLTLRRNQIEELPPQIARLRNLKSLDISLNSIEQLPYELIQLIKPYGRLERIHAHGNRLLTPTYDSHQIGSDAPFDVKGYRQLNPDLRMQSWVDELYQKLEETREEAFVWRIRFYEAWINANRDDLPSILPSSQTAAAFPHHPEPRTRDLFGLSRYMARTLVSYFDQAGIIMPGSPLPLAAGGNPYPIIFETNRGSYGAPRSPIYSPPSSSGVASLVTSCINVALKQDTVEETKYKIGEPVPFDVSAILSRAAKNDANMRYGYFRQCHVCRKDYIVARAEWSEFWLVGLVLLPMKVRVCSWGCVPAEVAKPSEHFHMSRRWKDNDWTSTCVQNSSSTL